MTPAAPAVTEGDGGRCRCGRGVRGRVDGGVRARAGGPPGHQLPRQMSLYAAKANRRSLCCMSAAAVVVGVSLVVILGITAVVMRVRRNSVRRQRDRVRRQRDESPVDRYRRELPDLRSSQTSQGGHRDAAEAPHPVVGVDDLAALVQRAVQDAPEREVFGNHRRLRRARRRRTGYGVGHLGWAGGSGGGDDGGDGGGCGGGGCGGGGD